MPKRKNTPSTPRDVDQDRATILKMLLRVRKGLILEHRRLTEELAATPTIVIPMSDDDELVEYWNWGDNPRLDLDYYTLELYRLRNLAEASKRLWSNEEKMRSAVASFNANIPGLTRIRDLLMHPASANNWSKLTFDASLIEMGESVWDSVDHISPHGEHHEMALALANLLVEDLRLSISLRLKDPQLPVHQQFNWIGLMSDT